MSVFKDRKIVMLPTEGKGPIVLGENLLVNLPGVFRGTNFHLYIISDGEIKEGDWCYLDNNIKELSDYNGNYIIKISKEQVESANIVKDCKKIIATTENWNGYLLPQPSQSFIDKYIESCNNGNIITDVQVEYENGYIDNRPVSNGVLKINSDNTIKMSTAKELNYWKLNAEEDYMKTPISVLRYISELESAVENSYTKEEVKEKMWFYIVQYVIAQKTMKDPFNETPEWFDKLIEDNL